MGVSGEHTMLRAIKRAIPQSLMPTLGAVRRLLGGQRAVFPSSIDILHFDNIDSETNGELFLVRAYAKYWRRCFDIGANRGSYARMIHGVNPSCEATLFEPNPELAANLRTLAAESSLPWSVVEAAVGASSGEITLHINTQRDTMSSIHRPGPETTARQVPLVSLDDYCRDHEIDYIDFCKIDTEGNEVAVLNGAKELIREQRIRMIQFEYGGAYTDAGTSLLDMYRLLGDRYVICHVEPVGLLPIPYDAASETFSYSNWVALSFDYLTSLPKQAMAVKD